MTSKRNLLVILALELLCPLLTSCGTSQATTSSCGYPAEVTVGNSTKNTPTGSCAGYFAPAAVASVHMSVGQTLTVHFGERGAASARSQQPKVIELTSENSSEQRFQAVAPGASEILYSPPIEDPGVCFSGFNQTMDVPCVIAKVTVTQSCGSKSSGNCRSSQNRGTAVSKGSTPQISPNIAALNAKQSPLAVMCEPGFFTKAQTQLIVQQFGLIECFRFSGENKWVVIGNGVPQQSSPPSSPTRGGIIVAMENCASSDRACLDPSAVHNFATFTVYYPPDTLGDFSPFLLYATSFGNLLSIHDFGYCSKVTFDMTNGQWYSKSTSDHLLETNPGDVPSLKTPAPVKGAKALAERAPLAANSAC